jgi:hypothetical protein
MKKRKGSIIPLGDFEKVSKHDQEEFERKRAHKATWCKRCGRKHSKREECEVLSLVEDLTRPPTKVDKDGEPVLNRKVGFYTTRKVAI